MSTSPCPDESALIQVPPTVRWRLRRALQSLREIAQEVQRASELEGRVGCCGRYQADVLNNRDDELRQARHAISTFRSRAAAHGIDAQAVLRALGGLVEPVLSPEASRWLPDRSDQLPQAPASDAAVETPDAAPR
jgi:hypothetical protein